MITFCLKCVTQFDGLGCLCQFSVCHGCKTATNMFMLPIVQQNKSFSEGKWSSKAFDKLASSKTAICCGVCKQFLVRLTFAAVEGLFSSAFSRTHADFVVLRYATIYHAGPWIISLAQLLGKSWLSILTN